VVLASESGSLPLAKDGGAEVSGPATGLVSVVLPCFDVGRFLVPALDSLLRQTYANFEVVALDDGSRDDTRAILKLYAARDSRVRVLSNERNLGLIPTLNRGVFEARGEFVARMDADDVCAPDRIQREVDLLVRKPTLGVVSVAARLVDPRGRAVGLVPVRCKTPAGARFMGLFAMPVVHAAIVARTAVMKKHPYGVDGEATHTEDYELFTRMLAAGVEFGNIDLPLYSIRIHPESMSRAFEDIQIRNFVACARRHLKRTTGAVPGHGAHKVLVNRIDRSVIYSDLREGLRYLDDLEELFLEMEPRHRAEITAIAAQQRADIVIQALLKGTWTQRRAVLALLLRYAPSLLSPPTRRHVAAKMGIDPSRHRSRLSAKASAIQPSQVIPSGQPIPQAPRSSFPRGEGRHPYEL
jgi:glycosyltransferase involved in cell wall biosynthesis